MNIKRFVCSKAKLEPTFLTDKTEQKEHDGIKRKREIDWDVYSNIVLHMYTKFFLQKSIYGDIIFEIEVTVNISKLF